MILTDKQITEKIKNKQIIITPPPTPEQIQPSSIDLKLDNEFYTIIPQEQPLDIKNQNPKYNSITGNAIILAPNQFILATTKEYITLPPNLVARVEGRSSLARLGIMIHVTAGFIDAGFEGNITLEIKNVSEQPIILYENMRIAQILFEELGDTPTRVYGECGNKYQGQTGVTGSMIFYDTDTDNYGGGGV